ncbi:DUF2884 family protein [Microbulbifer hydrolyticus]|uniref:DUF2884 family protein n=1 Tax=Microbulbifer hydrolyticus TaxID=48074 RepID=A0A6P1T893_9GAMM|nr:DUF2884 family protein [Microbulbifer hydrolyticus]MBB5211263.1 hypothetical protein [Microbulbifer hydrolyticus]QHQ37971.1 DUF2884 family protein [Microbulbifer hydrolyticus]
MKSLIPIALAVMTTSAAHGESLNLESGNGTHCSLDLHHQVTVGPGFIESRDSESSAPLFAYHAPDQLAVGDEGLILDEQQQALMLSYQQGLHSAGRDVTLISAEAMDIALDGVGIALATLAGAEDPDTQEFLASSEALRTKLLAEIQQPGDVYTFGGSWMEHAMGDTFERELEPQIEALAKKSAGAIAWHAMKAVFTGGASIERDAEIAAEAAEKAVEEKAERLEARASALCNQLSELDTLEKDVHKAIPELQGLDLVEVNSRSK